jgi:hypothetical protein
LVDDFLLIRQRRFDLGLGGFRGLTPGVLRLGLGLSFETFSETLLGLFETVAHRSFDLLLYAIILRLGDRSAARAPIRRLFYGASGRVYMSPSRAVVDVFEGGHVGLRLSARSG